jgi:hypothetical protein
VNAYSLSRILTVALRAAKHNSDLMVSPFAYNVGVLGEPECSEQAGTVYKVYDYLKLSRFGDWKDDRLQSQANVENIPDCRVIAKSARRRPTVVIPVSCRVLRGILNPGRWRSRVKLASFHL